MTEPTPTKKLDGLPPWPVLVWDADAVQRGIAAWRRLNYRLMQERDERKRTARKAKRERFAPRDRWRS